MGWANLQPAGKESSGRRPPVGRARVSVLPEPLSMSNPPAAPVPSTADQIQQLQQQLADMRAALLAKPPLPLQPSLSLPPSPSFPPPATILNDSVMLILVITLAVVVVLILLLIMGFVMLSPAQSLRNAIPFSDLFSRLDDEREAAPAAAGMAPAESKRKKATTATTGLPMM